MSTVPFTVIIDTREKKPYYFGPGVETVRQTLDTGDYSVEGFEDVFAVERKSLNDLLKSITWDRARFKNEIHRGNALGKFAVVIEAPKQQVLNNDYYSNVHPNAVIGTVESWQQANRVEFYWCGNRDGARKKTLELLKDWWTEYTASVLY